MKYDEEKSTPRQLRNQVRVILALILAGWGSAYLYGDVHFWMVVGAALLIIFIEKEQKPYMGLNWHEKKKMYD